MDSLMKSLRKIFIVLITLLLVSCCSFMYSSTPPYETSEQWRNEVNQREKIKFRVVAPGESNDDALWVIRKMSELLNKSGTFYCFLCRNLSSYEFSFVDTFEEDYHHQDYVQKQYAYKDQNPEERYYRDAFYLKVDALDPEHFLVRDTTISYYVPKEHEKNEAHVFTIAFTKCDVKGNDRDFHFDCRYSIWDSKNEAFYARGRLGQYSGMTKFDVASNMADHLAIALGLR